MTSVLWTVILHQRGTFSYEISLASREYRCARQELSERYPGKDVVAIVMGRHTTTHTFALSDSVTPSIDYCADDNNQPTRGSD